MATVSAKANSLKYQLGSTKTRDDSHLGIPADSIGIGCVQTTLPSVLLEIYVRGGAKGWVVVVKITWRTPEAMVVRVVGKYVYLGHRHRAGQEQRIRGGR